MREQVSYTAPRIILQEGVHICAVTIYKNHHIWITVLRLLVLCTVEDVKAVHLQVFIVHVELREPLICNIKLLL